jgi:hypothetical protein
MDCLLNRAFSPKTDKYDLNYIRRVGQQKAAAVKQIFERKIEAQAGD